MKPTPFSVTGKKAFPQTDCAFHSGVGDWRGYSSHGDEQRAELRRFFELSRQSRLICAQERLKEMAVFGVVVLVAAWPVIYMLITVVQALLRARQLE
jgi:hypothetical protein